MAQPDQSIFLSGLGVSVLEQAIKPCTVSFPSKFNPYGASVWSVIVRYIPDNLSVEAAWEFAITDYVTVCQEKGIHPFKAVATNNEKLIEVLTQNRNELLRELEAVEHPLLDQYSILEIDRKAELTSIGFVLSVTAIFKNTDPTFAQHLANLGFGPVNKAMTKRVSQQATLKFSQVQNLNSRWEVEYTIIGPQLPELPQMLATKEQLERFFVNGIWIPLTKQARPNHQGPRFI